MNVWFKSDSHVYINEDRRNILLFITTYSIFEVSFSFHEEEPSV